MQPTEPTPQPAPEVVTVPGHAYRRRNAYVVINVRPHDMRMPPRDARGRFTAGRKAPKSRAASRTDPLGAPTAQSPSLRDVERACPEPVEGDSQSERERLENLTPEQAAERTRTQVRYLISVGKTASQVARQLNKPLDSVREEAEDFWNELAEDFIETPLHVKVQAIMRAMNIYSQSCEALSAGEIRTAEKIKYMGLALDSSKEIVKYQSEIARDEKDADRDERITKEDLDLAISLLQQHIANLKKEEESELNTSPASGV